MPIYLVFKSAIGNWQSEINGHSNEILKAAAVAHGEKSNDTSANAPSK